MFLKAGLGWTANFINFAVHGAATKNNEITLLGHSFFFITACCLAMILCDATGQKFNIKKFSLTGVFLLSLSLITYSNTGNYFWSAMILDVFIGFTLIYFSVKTLAIKETEVIAKVLAVFLILNGLHFLDYPFLYNHPTGSIFGFSLAFLMCIMDSILLPTLILQINAKKYTNQLELIVTDRTAKLIERTDELERTNNENVILLSIVCHDISTPVTIANYSLTKLIKHSGLLNSDENISILKIKQSLGAVNDILRKVKDLHAGKLGKLELKIQALDIEPLIYEVIQMHQLTCDQKNIQLEFNIKDSHKKIVLIDPVLFKNQILGNLISNAIKFTEPGKKIEIQLSKKGSHIYVEILDQGIGIDSSRLDHLFDVRKATSTPGTNSEPGTGLGLPTVKIFTEKMGGQIEVSSNTGDENNLKTQGTIFSLYFKSAG